MPSSKKPKPSQHPDEVDLVTPSAIFIGARQLSSPYIYLKKADLDSKTFKPNTKPLIPAHGTVSKRYLAAMDYMLSGGVDDQGFVKPPSRSYTHRGSSQSDGLPGAADEGDRRKVPEVRTAVIRDLLWIDPDDEAYLFAIAKNIFCFKMIWKGTGMVSYIVKEALGMDRRHPSYKVYTFIVRKNRDTWQARLLGYSHIKAVWFLFTTESGKKVLQERMGKHWFTCDPANKRDRKLFIVDPALLIAEALNTIEVAKFIYREMLGSLDESKLEQNGVPTSFGNVLIAKSLSYIQLEISYVLASWTDFTTGVYTKDVDDNHCRDKGLMLPYLSTIDESTMYTRNVKRRVSKKVVDPLTKTVTTPAVYVKEKLGLLFPMEQGKVYTSSRRGGRSRKVNASNDKNVIKFTHNEDTEDEEETDKEGDGF